MFRGEECAQCQQRMSYGECAMLRDHDKKASAGRHMFADWVVDDGRLRDSGAAAGSRIHL